MPVVDSSVAEDRQIELTQPRETDRIGQQRFVLGGGPLLAAPERPGNMRILPVKDLAQAKNLFGTLLGVKPYVDEPYYVGFSVGDQEIGLDTHGHRQGMTDPVGYVQVDNIEEHLDQLLAAGAQSRQAVSDIGGGTLIVSVNDADSNIIGLIQLP